MTNKLPNPNPPFGSFQELSESILGSTCPCYIGSKEKSKSYKSCCARFVLHWPIHSAPSALDLMRSRFTAFVLQNKTYLLNTWHESTRPAELDFDSQTKWLGLDIKGHKNIDKEHAEVEFVARYRVQGMGQRLHEVSSFVRIDTIWYYKDGVMLNP